MSRIERFFSGCYGHRAVEQCESRDTYSIEGAPWKPIQMSHLIPKRFSISCSISVFTPAASSFREKITSFACSLLALVELSRAPRLERSATDGGGAPKYGRAWEPDWGLESLFEDFTNEAEVGGDSTRGRTRKWKMDLGYASKTVMVFFE